MHRAPALPVALVAAAAVGGCGGGKQHGPATTPPVADQVRHALIGALQTTRRPRLPYAAVGTCSGPAPGGAGRYRCATTPRGPHGVRAVTVRVRPDGSWATQPLAVEATLHGHTATAVTGVWGAGLSLPG